MSMFRINHRQRLQISIHCYYIKNIAIPPNRFRAQKVLKIAVSTIIKPQKRQIQKFQGRSKKVFSFVLKHDPLTTRKILILKVIIFDKVPLHRLDI